MELEPGIHQLTFGREPFSGFPTPNVFLVFGTETATLIDTGWDDPVDHDARLAYLRDVAAPPLSEIIITHRHPDHGGGALHMHRSTGAPISCHALDRQAIEDDRLHGEARVSAELQGGERRELGGLTLEVLFAPGHTAGCLAIYVPERGALFTSDTVMGVSTTLIRPEGGSLTDYLRSLALFESIGARTMYPGHGPPITDPAGRLRELIDHRKHRERQILAELAKGPRRASELRQAMYVGLPEVRERIAEMQVVTGLKKLMEEGVVRAEDDRYALT